MAKFELSLSSEYASHWGIVEAVREIFQNAIDQETVQADNPMFIEYHKDAPKHAGMGLYYESTGTLRIGNRNSVLDAKSLLLGVTTKRGDDKTIGQFGEGYKIALLVLARLGKKVTIYNYGRREVWRPRLSKLKKYGDVKALVVETDTKYFWQNVPDNDLVFEIEGITDQEYKKIVESNLALYEKENPLETITTMYGRILLDGEMRGMVFVRGLFVNMVKGFQYGYDLNPKYVQLDRDRRMVADFDLKWKTSHMWHESGSPLVIDLAKDDAPDVEYLANQSNYCPAPEVVKVQDSAFEEFTEQYGENAIPVTTQSEAEAIYKLYGKEVKAIVSTPAMKHLVTSSPAYKISRAEVLVEKEPPRKPVEVMTELYYTICNDLEGEALEMAWRTLLLSQDWDAYYDPHF